MKMNRIKLHKQVETMNKEQLICLCKSLININCELEDRIDRIKNIYTSMQFAAPEIMHIFIEKLGHVLEGEDNE